MVRILVGEYEDNGFQACAKCKSREREPAVQFILDRLDTTRYMTHSSCDKLVHGILGCEGRRLIDRVAFGKSISS